MKATMNTLAAVNRLMNTLVEMGFMSETGGSNGFELFAEDGTDVYVRFYDDDGDDLRWKVIVERDCAHHVERWDNLHTKEVESILNHAGMFDNADLERIEFAYNTLREYSNPYTSPHEQAEALYETGFYREYWMEVDYLMKVYRFLQRPEWERSIQFDRVCRILHSMSDEEAWFEWKMDL